jgi:transcriptional regulator with XRE-family HTH domain
MDKENFGKRLASLRIMAGLSQKEFADAAGISPRMVVYYERHAKRPPTDRLNSIAKALNVSENELLGLTPDKRRVGAPKNAYLHKKLLIVDKLPREDQKALMTMIDKMAKANGLSKDSEK